MKKTKELRDQTIEELEAQERALQKELFALRTQMSVDKKVDQPHLFRQHKRERARILTILTEKKVG